MYYKVEQDNDPENPREWDNLGTMACFHSRYRLGDKHDLSVVEAQDMAESDNYISLPLYLYDHSALTMNVTGFSCPWDSGQVGLIFVSKARIREEYGWVRLTKERVQQIKSCLRSEVETFDRYLRGDVYGFTVYDDDGNHVDSCWGFYGYDEVEGAAKESLRFYDRQEKLPM